MARNAAGHGEPKPSGLRSGYRPRCHCFHVQKFTFSGVFEQRGIGGVGTGRCRCSEGEVSILSVETVR